MTKTVFAHTPLVADFPPFVNLSRKEDGSYALTVRSHGNGGRDLGTIQLSAKTVEALAYGALADLCQESADPVVNGPFASQVTLHVVDPGPDSLEREIQARGLPAARYVTPADIEAEIAAEYSTTLDKALAGCPLLEGMDRVTVAVIVLKNGTKLVGVNYGAIDPARHSPEMGAKEARAAAIEQAWPLLGFRLRDELARPVLTEADALADLAGETRPS